MEDIKVLLFDDNKRIRESLSMLIENTDGFLITGSYENCMDVLHIIEAEMPDVILMDIDMPGMSGIEAVSLIRDYYPTMHILMQTVFEDDDKIFDAVCAGASGYILKNTPPAVIISSILEAFHGGAPMSPSVAKKVLSLFQKNIPQLKKETYNLTAKESEVLAYLVNGKSYKMIADSMDISYETVRKHMQHIYSKLHVSSMTEAVAKAIHDKMV